MTYPLFLTRARMKSMSGIDRLGPILFPEGADERSGVTHQLVWSLFPKTLKDRPFLYRETAPGEARGRAARAEILILSKIEPDSRHELLDVETKSFEPNLAAGDNLGFSLRANPAVNRRDANGCNRRHDVVMDALHATPQGARAELRRTKIEEAGRGWLEEQGRRSGFAVADAQDGLRIDGYDQIRIERAGAGRGREQAMRHSRLDFQGVLRVTEPALFLSKLAEGFGRARAFGHGLMLIRRVRL